MSGSAVFRANPVIIYHIIAPRTSEKLFAERLAPFPRKKRNGGIPCRSLCRCFFSSTDRCTRSSSERSSGRCPGFAPARGASDRRVVRSDGVRPHSRPHLRSQGMDARAKRGRDHRLFLDGVDLPRDSRVSRVRLSVRRVSGNRFFPEDGSPFILSLSGDSFRRRCEGVSSPRRPGRGRSEVAPPRFRRRDRKRRDAGGPFPDRACLRRPYRAGLPRSAAPDRRRRRSVDVHRQEGRGTVIVSRGAGTWGPPVRLLALPEILIVDIVRP